MIDKQLLRKALPDVIAIVAFILISFMYFASPVLEDKVLIQHDSHASIGVGEESREYHERTGKTTRWINSMFGGMPTYQMAPSYDSSAPQEVVKKAYSLSLPLYVAQIFIMLLGFYILMRAFNCSPLISVFGAVTWTFSSYFFIIISAGHFWKLITLAYIPPTIAGMVYIYRKKYLIGALLFMIFTAFQISSNHFQMSYYFMIVMIAIAVAYLIEAIKEKQLPHFFKASIIICIAGAIGIMANSSTLYHTHQYTKQSMRGESELSRKATEGSNATKSKGLERDYIVQWSYGIGETFSFLVPNVKGGASVPLSHNEKAMSKADPKYYSIYSQIGQYWGEQPGTSGPVYVGAFVLTLFILGLIIVKGPMKWALLFATILSIILSWGKNFMGFTDFFIDYVPLYNKFRAVSSILVVAEFTIPLLAALALKELFFGNYSSKEIKKDIYISFACTGGIALLFAIFPRLFFSSFVSSSEIQALSSFPSEHQGAIMANLEEMRIAMFRADAWRSLIIIALGSAILWIYASKKLAIKSGWIIAAITILCLVDMWGVDKRYLNDGDFKNKTEKKKIFSPTEADKYIKQDADLFYRVLNLTTSTFNDGTTPYIHKSIGGYHAAKLGRYQDIIEHYLSKEIPAFQNEVITNRGDMELVNSDKFKVLNMLNTKWAILPGQDNSSIPIKNPYAQGNAWFVSKLKYVENADEEINAIGSLNLRDEAVADKKFSSIIASSAVTSKDSLSSITLTDYDADRLLYKVDAQKDELAVFSDIYYPKGWKITIDGEPVEMMRVNYILRALPIPKGEHSVEFHFNPTSLKTTDTIAYVALSVIALLAIYILVHFYRKQKEMISGNKK